MTGFFRTNVKTEARGPVYCYMCTHVVEATVVRAGKHAAVKVGQKCPRCGSALDSGYVMSLSQAA